MKLKNLFIPRGRTFFKLCFRAKVFPFKVNFLSFSNLRVGYFSMKPTTSEKLKVFHSVIFHVVVNVVHNFLFSKMPTKMFFHNYSMYSNISLLPTKWVRKVFYVKVATSGNRFYFHNLFSSSKFNFFYSSKALTERALTSTRAKTSNLNRLFFKVFSATLFTNMFNHNGIITKV